MTGRVVAPSSRRRDFLCKFLSTVVIFGTERNTIGMEDSTGITTVSLESTFAKSVNRST